MIYPSNFESKIGFTTIRKEINSRCISAMGRDCCEKMRFSPNIQEVTLWLNQTNEFLGILQSKREFPLNFFFDMRPALRAIAVPGSHLSEESLFNLQRSLSTVGEIERFFERTSNEGTHLYPNLSRLAKAMQSFPEIVAEISRVLDKNGIVKDSASPLLQELRRAIANATASINGLLRKVINAGREAGYLDKDTTPSMRDGRLVIPVSPMHKRKLRGIVHDESATGRTIFIEPEEVVEANNRIREAEGEVKREIIRILTEVTDMIRPHADELIATYRVLGMIDFIRAKAVFAQDVDGQLPHIEKNPHIELYHAVHPALLLSLREQGKEVVPLNIELNHERRILLISGPNAGGKSVCLKTVGVVQYMMQCGVLPTVYYNSHMGMFNSIFIDIGDQQSIEDDLSTYSSHLQNMKTFLTRGDKHSLVLIDEFGSGTEPQIGGAIAQAILEQLNKSRIMGVITTHYQNLKHFADEAPGIVNGAMLYDRQQMKPLFQLSIGYPGSSFAIEIARKTGIPHEVIDKASEIVGSDYINMDKYLLDIVRDRKYWESKRYDIHKKEKKLNAIAEQYNERLEKLNNEYKAILKEARNEALDIIAKSNSQVEQTIRGIKEAEAEKEKTRLLRQQLEEFKQRLAQDDENRGSEIGDRESEIGNRRSGIRNLSTLPSPLSPVKKKHIIKKDDKDRPLLPGDNVLLKGGASTVGTIISIDEKYAVVAFGSLKTRVETERLERTMRKTEVREKPSITKSTADDIRARQLNFKSEIDVRGMRADEAIQAVTYFLDDAIQFSYKTLRILHGTGTGALREAIRQYLNTVPDVRNYHDEHVQLGGAGITVVNLE
ncbi:MAG: Smr/MutS family protein [Muribaculaceae bacterium]|nr:Smr/MutS family protein [Muribaculaceae bacterium]